MAFFFYPSFIMMTTMVMLHIFTAIIVENYDRQLLHDAWALDLGQLEVFREEWGKYDDGTGTIHVADLLPVLKAVERPLGLGERANYGHLMRHIKDLGIQTVRVDRLGFQRTLGALVKKISEAMLPAGPLADKVGAELGPEKVLLPPQEL